MQNSTLIWHTTHTKNTTWGSFPSAQVAAVWGEWMLGAQTRLKMRATVSYMISSVTAQCLFSLISPAASLPTIVSLPWPWKQLRWQPWTQPVREGWVQLCLFMLLLALVPPAEHLEAPVCGDPVVGKGSLFSLIVLLLGLWCPSPQSNVSRR